MSAIAPLSNPVKVTSLAIGGGLGLGAGVAAQRLLPSAEKERQLEAQGIHTISDREARATFAPIAFVAAAGVGAGIGRRNQGAALTAATLGAAAMLASTGASTMINAENESVDKYLRTIGLMSGVAAGGFAIGSMDKVPINRAKTIGLGFMGLAVGALLPETTQYVASLPGDLARSLEYGGQ